MIVRELEKARIRATGRQWRSGKARLQSSEVADVVNRPKKRPGNRLRSSITTGATNKQAMLI